MSSSGYQVSMDEGTKEDRDFLEATWTQTMSWGSATITWEQLRKVARDHWDWIMRKYPKSSHERTTHSRQGQGSCLVAALFLPQPHLNTGVIFLSTIPEGSQKKAMKDWGSSIATAWWTANNGRDQGYHAEDSAIFNFERSGYSSGVVQGTHYVPNPNMPHSRMRIAVWGRHSKGKAGTGFEVPACDGSQDNGKKHPHPSCQDLCYRLNIDFYTASKERQEKKDMEEERIRKLEAEELARKRASEERKMMKAAEEAERRWAEQNYGNPYSGGGYNQYHTSAHPSTSSHPTHSHHGGRPAANDPLSGAFNKLSIASNSSPSSNGHSSRHHHSGDPKKASKSAAPKTSSSSKSGVKWEFSKSQGKYYYMQGGKRVYAK